MRNARLASLYAGACAAALSSTPASLVSIVGAGGIGKTTVALAVAERVAPSFKDGVWLVDLAPLKDPSLAPNAIATVIGLTAHSANMLTALGRLLPRSAWSS